MKISSINQSIQREHNLSMAIEAIRRIPHCTRVKLAQVMGLSQAAVTKLVSQLIEWGAVSEQESIGNGLGRKATALRINTEKYRALAIHINRDYINAAIYDMDGVLYDMEQCEISASEGAQASMDRVIAMARKLLSRNQTPVRCVGVAVPGPFHYSQSRISMMSGFPGWEKINIRKTLEQALLLPVFVDQDANCGALAEMWFGGEDQPSSMIFVTADRGIGAGLILNSKIYRGRIGFAGEIGHTSIDLLGARCECGNRGCLELYGSSVALENICCTEQYNPANPDTMQARPNVKDILKQVREGDPNACRAYAKTVSYLCFGIVGVINTLDPEVVVFGDRLVNGGSLFLETAKQTFRQYLMPEVYDHLQIKVCTLDGDPMLLGASVLAYDHVLRAPSEFFNA